MCCYRRIISNGYKGSSGSTTSNISDPIKTYSYSMVM